MGEKLLVVCEQCGKQIYKTPYRIAKSKHHFCSNECSHKWRHEQSIETCVCQYCGKDFSRSKKSSQKFCSAVCHNSWQKENSLRGSENPRWKRKKVKCDYCGKEIEIHLHEMIEHKNHFCSIACRRSWYSEVWCQTDEWKNQSRERAVRILKSNAGTTQTRPQIITNELLSSLNIEYENERDFKYYSVDNYLVDYNLIIEVMGDYWHGNPTNQKELNDTQRKNQRRDCAKHTFILNHYGVQILYLWETDLLTDPDKCTALIKEYITHSGKLSNFHSYNYDFQNKKLLLK